jgi:hypothetical protein
LISNLTARQHTVDLKPDRAAAYVLMGMVLFQLEEYEKASTTFSDWSKYLLL